jgi:hypothetical protein
MALKTLQCCGDASLPEQRSTLRGMVVVVVTPVVLCAKATEKCNKNTKIICL